MKIIETSFTKFRTVTANVSSTSQKSDFFSTVSKEGVQFWSLEQVLEETQGEKEDLIFKLEPARSIKLNQMILCCTITEIKAEDHEVHKKVAKKKDVKTKAIKKKRNKLSKDERKLLKR